MIAITAVDDRHQPLRQSSTTTTAKIQRSSFVYGGGNNIITATAINCHR